MGHNNLNLEPEIFWSLIQYYSIKLLPLNKYFKRTYKEFICKDIKMKAEFKRRVISTNIEF